MLEPDSWSDYWLGAALMLVLGIELGSCGRAVAEELYVLLTPEPSPQPEGRLPSDVLVVGALFCYFNYRNAKSFDDKSLSLSVFSYQPEVITQRFLVITSRKFLANVTIRTHVHRCRWLYRLAIGHIPYQIFSFLVLFKSVRYRSFPSAWVVATEIHFTARVYCNLVNYPFAVW